MLNLLYCITFIKTGVDKAGECNMSVSNFTVDETPPTNGRITAGPYFDLVSVSVDFF